ncbi:MAG: hypothetical protein C4320_06925 [Armatimonadota bacterium]
MKISRLTPLALLFLVAGARADYSFLVTNSPFNTNAGPYTNGILRYNIGTGGAATAMTGISSANIVDPEGLAFDSTGRLFVGNRNGNDAHPNGGSVSVFSYDAVGNTFTFDSNFQSGGTGTHGLSFSPVTGELFVANLHGPISRFLGLTTNGSINSGEARGVTLSPDGQFAYVTRGINGSLLKFDVATGNPLNSFAIPGASSLHFGTWRGNDLYLADFNSSAVYSVSFNGAGDVTGSSAVVTASGALSVAFSPDGNEMFVPSALSGIISRFVSNGSGWTANGTINTGVNMGDIRVVPATAVPEPTSMFALGLGALGLLRRRRS